uniref:Putative secreted protein n=1 Tax=Rhipicephalus microplus TaxID=6941 RepID=A0A6M2DBN3_RHIMP
MWQALAYLVRVFVLAFFLGSEMEFFSVCHQLLLDETKGRFLKHLSRQRPSGASRGRRHTSWQTPGSHASSL